MQAVEENKRFLGLLYDNEELVKASRWFDKLEGSSTGRQSDEEMTLDKFLEGIDSESSIIFQLASPDPVDITYCAFFNDFSKDVERFAWVTCHYNDNNFNVVSRLYEEAFGCKLEDEPVPKWCLAYYEKVRRGC